VTHGPLKRRWSLIYVGARHKHLGANLVDENDASKEIASIRRRLADLNAERMSLERKLETIEQKLISDCHASDQQFVIA